MTFHSLQTPLFQPSRKRHCALRFSQPLGHSWEPRREEQHCCWGLNPLLGPEAGGFVWRADNLRSGHPTKPPEVRGARPPLFSPEILLSFFPKRWGLRAWGRGGPVGALRSSVQESKWHLIVWSSRWEERGWAPFHKDSLRAAVCSGQSWSPREGFFFFFRNKDLWIWARRCCV